MASIVKQRGGKIRGRLGSLAVAFALVLSLGLGMASAAGLEATMPDCPRWVANADSYLDECKSHARHFTRTFYPSGLGRGEKEDNSVWFPAAPADSHFFVGCTFLKSGALRYPWDLLHGGALGHSMGQ